MPSPPAPQLDQPAVLEFPFSGMDSSAEFELQPAGTTVFGSNVRTFEAQTLRGRGGSRPGLTAHVNDQLPGAIQCMGIVSIASPDAALTDDGIGGQTNPDDPGFNPGYTGGGGSTTGGGPSGFVLDPSDDTLFDHGKRKKPRNPAPHWKWRRGGSGVHRPKRRTAKDKSRPQTPTASDVSITIAPGDQPADIDVLAAANFIGVPSVKLDLPMPYLGGGTLSQLGKSIDTLLNYAPPTSGQAQNFVVPFEITATGNRGKAIANLNIELLPSKIELVQSSIKGFDLGTGGNTASLSGETLKGSIIIAVVVIRSASPGSITGLGVSATGWTNVGFQTVHEAPANADLSASIWYKKAAAAGDGGSGTFTPSQSAVMNVCLIEYKGAGSVGSFASDSSTNAGSGTLTGGSVTIAHSGDAVVGGFGFANYATAGLITAGGTVSLVRSFDGEIEAPLNDCSLYVVDAVDLEPGSIVPSVVDSSGAGDLYVGVSCRLSV